MISRWKKRIGGIARGLVGMWQNQELVPNDALEKQVLTRSTEGREVDFYVVGEGALKILLVGGTHGNEVGTVKLMRHILCWLNDNPQALSNLTVQIIPCLNPDGFALAQKNPDYFNGGRIGRFNGRNVDLNRNYPTKNFQSQSDWNHGKNYQERTKVFCGEKGASEPEIKALTELVAKEDIELVIAFHSAGRDVMANKQPLAREVAKLFSEKTGFRLSTDKEWEDLKQTGTARGWCEENDIAYIEIEASTRWGSDWEQQKSGLLAAIELLNKI